MAIDLTPTPGKRRPLPLARAVVVLFASVWGVLGVMAGAVGVVAAIVLAFAPLRSSDGSIPRALPLAVMIACADVAVIIFWGRGWYLAFRRAEAAEIACENMRDALADKNAELERARERREDLENSVARLLGHVAALSRQTKSGETAETSAKPLTYLANIDEELEWAVLQMSYRSAWGRWYSAQQLAANGSVDEASLLLVATSLVEEAAVDGKIAVRGRRPSEIIHEQIPREAWRLAAIIPQFDHGKQDWTIRVIPRSGVDTKRIANLLSYDSLIVNAMEFESKWPESHEGIDASCAQLLAQAVEREADPRAIERIRMSQAVRSR